VKHRTDHESTFDIIKRRHGRTELQVSDLWSVINEQEAKIRWLFVEIDQLRRRFSNLNQALGLRHDVSAETDVSTQFIERVSD